MLLSLSWKDQNVDNLGFRESYFFSLLFFFPLRLPLSILSMLILTSLENQGKGTGLGEEKDSLNLDFYAGDKKYPIS